MSTTALTMDTFGHAVEIGTSGAGRADPHVCFRTTCGREISVGHLALGGGCHPAQRVSLGIGASSGAGDGTWAGLTADEARRLAAALLTKADTCDGPPGTAARERSLQTLLVTGTRGAG